MGSLGGNAGATGSVCRKTRRPHEWGRGTQECARHAESGWKRRRDWFRLPKDKASPRVGTRHAGVRAPRRVWVETSARLVPFAERQGVPTSGDAARRSARATPSVGGNVGATGSVCRKTRRPHEWGRGTQECARHAECGWKRRRHWFRLPKDKASPRVGTRHAGVRAPRRVWVETSAPLVPFAERQGVPTSGDAARRSARATPSLGGNVGATGSVCRKTRRPDEWGRGTQECARHAGTGTGPLIREGAVVRLKAGLDASYCA